MMKLLLAALLLFGMNSPSRAILCWVCDNAADDMTCETTGALTRCATGEVCQNEVRRISGVMSITKSCKQSLACGNNRLQNIGPGSQCNVRRSNFVCRCCCNTDSCNKDKLFCINGCGKGTCEGRCDNATDNAYPCQCNEMCIERNNCCPDYLSRCLSASNLETCHNRCDDRHIRGEPCHCNQGCRMYNDCCTDYSSICQGPAGDYISDDELESLSLILFDLDMNRAKPGDVITNIQSRVNLTAREDHSPEKFFSYVNEELFELPTYKSLIRLFDNYVMMHGIDEEFSDEEIVEMETFLDAFLATQVGETLYRFFDRKGLVGCADKSTFKDYLHKMWFGLYSRRNDALDTSGFEHVFVGESRRNSLTGFHSWIRFYLLEKDNRFNYYGYFDVMEPELYTFQFEVGGLVKPVSGTYVGGSPEYELAVFTLCHMVKRNSVCNVLLRNGNGNSIAREIQTYIWRQNDPGFGLKFVGTSYFIGNV